VAGSTIEVSAFDLIEMERLSIYIRSRVRAIEFARMTVGQVREEALKVIGTFEAPPTPAVPESEGAKKPGEPPGQLNRLFLLQKRADTLFAKYLTVPV